MDSMLGDSSFVEGDGASPIRGIPDLNYIVEFWADVERHCLLDGETGRQLDLLSQLAVSCMGSKPPDMTGARRATVEAMRLLAAVSPYGTQPTGSD